jgi:hypothetical protein
VPALLVLLLVIIFVFAFALVMLPISLILRYRAGSARRRARGWIVTLNFIAATLSALMLLVTAGFSNLWIPEAFAFTCGGLAVGFTLGLLGLWASRWEATHQALHYTPNRWLILLITLVVTCRIGYSFWRGWHAWRAAFTHESLLDAAGAADAMAAGAMVLGYYVVYWAGLRSRLKRHQLL